MVTRQPHPFPPSNEASAPNPGAPSVRRNLFHAHLSRRPASSTSNGTVSTMSSASTLHASTRPVSTASTSTAASSTAPTSLVNAASHTTATGETATQTSYKTNPTRTGGGSFSTDSTLTNNPFSSEIVPRDHKTGLYIPPPSRTGIINPSSVTGLPPQSPSRYNSHFHTHSRATSASSTTTITTSANPIPADLTGFETTQQRAARDKEKLEAGIKELLYAHRQRTRHISAASTATGAGSIAAETAELLALVRASLDSKVASLEEDRWIFEGDDGAGVGDGLDT